MKVRQLFLFKVLSIMKSLREQHKDFEVYSRALIESEDVDPVYPFLRNYFKQYKIENAGQKMWFLFCYVSFYSLHSAHHMIKEFPYPWDFDVKEFVKMRQSKKIAKFGIERRGSLRNPLNQVDQLLAAADIIKNQKFDYSSNQGFRKHIATLPFQGEWSSFKLAELTEKVVGVENLTPADLGIDGKDPNSNDGAVGGLRWLFGREFEYEEGTKKIWNDFGSRLAKNWGVDVGKVETCFCKWHKMFTGKYYIGHDIHELADMREVMGEESYAEVMTQSFDPEIWENIDGILKKNKLAYKMTGKIINQNFARKLPKIDVSEIMIETIDEHGISNTL